MYPSTIVLVLLLPLVRAQNYGYNPQNQQPVNQFENYPPQNNDNNRNFPTIMGPDGKPVPQGPGPAMQGNPPYGPGPVVGGPGMYPNPGDPSQVQYLNTNMYLTAHDQYNSQEQEKMQGKRVQLQLQLLSYSNPQRWVAGGMQCYDTGAVPNINPNDANQQNSGGGGAFGGNQMARGQARMAAGGVPGSPYSVNAQYQNTGPYNPTANAPGYLGPNSQQSPQQQPNRSPNRQPNNQYQANNQYQVHTVVNDSTRNSEHTQAGGFNTGNSDLDCQVSIITVVTSPSDPPQVISTIMPMQLTSSRTTLDLTSNTVDPTWVNPITFYLKQMPTAVDVIVIQTGTLRFRNGSWPYRAGKYTAVMDTFKLPLSSDPSVYPGQSGRFSLKGNLIDTQLTMAMNYNCLQQSGTGGGVPFAGRDCDLVCNYTLNSNQYAACHSVINGTKQLCNRNGQYTVNNCQVCYLGYYYTEQTINGNKVRVPQRCMNPNDYKRIDSSAEVRFRGYNFCCCHSHEL